MNILFDKLVPIAFYPLGLSILLVLGGIALVLLGKRQSSLTVFACALTILWLFSTPLVSRVLLSTLEQTNSLQAVSSADVAILLGGMVRDHKAMEELDLTDSVDRALKALRLFRQGRVKYILVTGGNLTWSTDYLPEAEQIASLLEEWGVRKDALLIENRSRNTFENARNSKVIWETHGFSSGLLVTSASHMRRALAVFRRAGFPVDPAATDFRLQPYLTGGILALLPDAQALEDSTMAIKEWIGLAVYKLRGWA